MNRRLPAGAHLVLLATCYAAAGAARPVAVCFVSPNGNDAWSGGRPDPNPERTDGPLATLDAAKRAVRKLRRAGAAEQPVTVYLRGGRYELSEPLVFGPEDSGSADAPVTYLRFRDERPVLDGGRRLTGWQVKGNLWTVTIPEVRDGTWWFNELFVDGHRRQRAKTPNEGFLHVASYDAATADGQKRDRTAFVYAPGDLEPWPDLADALVVVYHSWETSLLRVKDLDTDRHIVEFTGPANWHFGYWGPNQRYTVENVRAALDQPGEWQLDRRSGVLSYLPLPGEDPATAEVVAPVVTELVRFAGDTRVGLPVSHITLRGLALQYADWALEPGGHSDPQAVCSLGGTVTMAGATNCALVDCELAHVGTYGIAIRTGSSGCRVERCHLHDLGSGGVRIGETVMPADPADRVVGNVVDNTYIHDFGEVYAAGVGVYIAQSSDNRVTHNEVHSGYYSGMSIGWNWGSGPTDAHNNLIADNHIHHVLRGLLSDGGGIYTLGTSPGTVLRGNVIHDIFSYTQPTIAWGIYLDAESNHITVENNLCYNLQNGGLMMHNGGHANVVRNNIFARASHQLIWRSPSSITEPNDFQRNICWVTQGDLFLYDGTPDTTSTWDHNLYWRTDDQELAFMDDSFDDWQARGLDQSSLVADPGFVDPEHNDLRLRPDSPAVARLGFQPLDPSAAGLYGDPQWVALPKQVAFAPTELPAPAVRLTGEVQEGFEELPPDQLPAAMYCYLGEVAGARVEVTEERAAVGQRSLKVTDAAGLKNTWDPHFFYQPGFRRGLATCRYRLYLEPGAMPWVEWRDGGYPYHVGPSYHIEADGRLTAGGKLLATLPHGRWITFEARCKLGKQADGTWELTVTPDGGTAETFTDLACDPLFKRLGWLGFVSLATTETVFYLDEVEMEATQP